MFTQPPEPPVHVPIPVPINYPVVTAASTPIELPPLPPIEHQSTDNIFADKTMSKDIDVTSIITKRLNAMRKLQDNPMDSEAIKLMYRTQKDVSTLRLNGKKTNLFHVKIQITLTFF